MASHPDPVWLEHVRQLTSANEPEIRIGAARLLAPHDPESARKVLEAAQQDPNPALRGMATDALGDVQASDLATLRKLMKSNNRSTGVRAAARVLVVLR
jgi:HEAT repeat protein